MKKIFIIALLIISFPLAVKATEDHNKSISEVLSEILSSQNTSQISDVDCQKITNGQFEELGDAVMEQRHPDEQHIVMDNMMGGEGSETLQSMHISMGQNYIGCNTNKQYMNSDLMGGNMASGFMSKNSFRSHGGFGMMSGFGTSFFSLSYSITMLLIWTLLALGIIALIKWIKK